MGPPTLEGKKSQNFNSFPGMSDQDSNLNEIDQNIFGTRKNTKFSKVLGIDENPPPMLRKFPNNPVKFLRTSPIIIIHNNFQVFINILV